MRALLAGLALVLAVAVTQASTQDETFTVTNNGTTSYVINGVNNKALALVKGNTYTFNINASGHPFYIKSIQGSGTSNAWTEGVTGNGTQVGTLTFTVPQDAPATLFYNCQFHSTMTSTITIPQGAPGVAPWSIGLLVLLLAAGGGFVLLRRRTA